MCEPALGGSKGASSRRRRREGMQHIDGIVLNVTKFRIQILPWVISRSARTIEVLSAYLHAALDLYF